MGTSVPIRDATYPATYATTYFRSVLYNAAFSRGVVDATVGVPEAPHQQPEEDAFDKMTIRTLLASPPDRT